MGYLGNILLVDDDQDTREIYKEILTQAGYNLDLATNGEEGLLKISQSRYDLILLDIMMPKIDGLGILNKLKSQNNSQNGPIIVLSALNQENIIKQALGLGAKGFLSKSDLAPNEVLVKIQEFLKKP